MMHVLERTVTAHDKSGMLASYANMIARLYNIYPADAQILVALQKSDKLELSDDMPEPFSSYTIASLRNILTRLIKQNLVIRERAGVYKALDKIELEDNEITLSIHFKTYKVDDNIL